MKCIQGDFDNSSHPKAASLYTKEFIFVTQDAKSFYPSTSQPDMYFATLYTIYNMLLPETGNKY